MLTGASPGRGQTIYWLFARSFLVFALAWFGAAVLTTTLGDVFVDGWPYFASGTWLPGVARNAGFAAIECCVSAVIFWFCLAIVYLLGFPKLFHDWRQGVCVASVLAGLALGLLEVWVAIPFAMYAWAGHDYETLAEIGPEKFYIGVIFESLSGLAGCTAGSLSVGRLWIHYGNNQAPAKPS